FSTSCDLRRTYDLVHRHARRIHAADSRVARLEHCQLRLQFVCKPFVVIVEKRNIGRGGTSDTSISGGTRTLASLESNAMQSRIAKGAHDIDCGRVARAVVDDEDFEIAHRLPDHAQQGLMQSLRPIVSGNDYAYPRHVSTIRCRKWWTVRLVIKTLR